MRRTRVVGGAIGLGLAGMAGPAALAFGTTHSLGQNAEHERITRHALACPAAGRDCFQPASLDELAGARLSFGAVGAPDRGDLIFQHKAHCDSGDHLDIPGYAHSAADARANLDSCRDWAELNLGKAVVDAGRLVGADGRLKASQIGMPCVFLGRIGGRAKCDVLQDFGLTLHVSQDFYAHTNWVDRPDPALPVGPANPPGLGRSGPAPWISLRGPATAPPPGLISGCFVALPETRFCNEGPGGRVKHAALNKDEGVIDPAVGGGATVRGRLNDNFRRAVLAAIDDTADKWALLRERLTRTYGAARGALMACAISHDRPETDCGEAPPAVAGR